jgi:hypothetical protein
MRASFSLNIYFDCKKDESNRYENKKGDGKNEEEISFQNKDYCVIEEEEEDAKNYSDNLRKLLKIQ